MPKPRIALIYPYFRTKAPTEMLMSPLGVAALAAQLRQLGLETRIFDCTFSTFEQIQADLLDYQPDLAGIYCMISLSRNTFRLAEMIRKRLPGCLLAAGGPLPTLYPEHFAGAFEVVFRGEADGSFPHFCRDFLQAQGAGQMDWKELARGDYAGLYVQREGLQVEHPPVHLSEEAINSLPLPDRRDFDHAAYQKAGMERDGRKTTSIILTYGCPFDCDFCSKPVFGSRFRRRDIDRVMEEIEQVRQLGYDHLWIADDCFTLDPRYLKEFCQRMDGNGPTWSCLSRVSGVNAEMARLMRMGGCRKVYLGLETGSQDTLQLMNKGTTVEAGRTAVHLFHEAGIQVGAFFIVGYPGETPDSIESTFRLALELPLDEISFNVPFPLPGSKLFERVSEVDTKKDWDQENEVAFVYRSEFDEAWLRDRIEATLKEFSLKNGRGVAAVK